MNMMQIGNSGSRPGAAVLPVIVAALGLSACASGPSDDAYVEAESPEDYGYYEEQLTDSRYRVSFTGNGATRDEAVKDMALLRAAELTLEDGYDWFRVETQDTEREVVVRPRTETAIGEDRVVYRDCGVLGCTTTVSPVYERIEVISNEEQESYSTSIEIMMGEGEVEDMTRVYNARELYGYLSDRY